MKTKEKNPLLTHTDTIGPKQEHDIGGEGPASPPLACSNLVVHILCVGGQKTRQFGRDINRNLTCFWGFASPSVTEKKVTRNRQKRTTFSSSLSLLLLLILSSSTCISQFPLSSLHLLLFYFSSNFLFYIILPFPYLSLYTFHFLTLRLPFPPVSYSHNLELKS